MIGVPLDTRMSLLRQYGNFTQAYSATVQSELSHFGDANGFIAFKRIWGTAMVLADPVAPLHIRADLIDRFLGTYPDAAFWDISLPVARILQDRGFLVNELGIETRLDLSNYNFDGQRKRNLRKASRHAAQSGYVIRESCLADVEQNVVHAVSDAWRRTRPVANREVTFLNRPIVFDVEPDVRWFFAFDRDQTIVAFCICDPIYEAGTIFGYSASTRQRPDVNLMIGQALKRHVIETVRQEGKRLLSLGLSPVEKDEKIEDIKRSWAVRRALRFAYRNWLFNHCLYPLQGQALHKRQFDGAYVQTFLAFNKEPGVLRLVKLLRACSMI